MFLLFVSLFFFFPRVDLQHTNIDNKVAAARCTLSPVLRAFPREWRLGGKGVKRVGTLVRGG